MWSSRSNVAIALFLDVPVGIAFITFLPAAADAGHLRLRGRRAARLRQQYGLRVRFVHYLKLVVGRPLLPGAPRRCRGARRLARAARPQRLGADQPRRRHLSPVDARAAPPRQRRRACRDHDPSRRRTDVHRPRASRRPAVRGCAGRPSGDSPYAARRRSARSSRARARLILCACAPGAILVVQGWNIADYPTVSDDEGTYLAQAWAVQQGKGLAHYTYWYDHPPLGWIQIAALSWIPSLLTPGPLTVARRAFAMLLVSAVSAVLVYVLGAPSVAAALGGGARDGCCSGCRRCRSSLQRADLPRQHRGDLDAARVLPGRLRPSRHLWHHFAAGCAPPSRCSPRRRCWSCCPRCWSRCGGTATATPASSRSPASSPPACLIGVLVPALRPAQRRVVPGRRPCLAARRDPVPDAARRFRAPSSTRGTGSTGACRVLALLRPGPAARRPRRRGARRGRWRSAGSGADRRSRSCLLLGSRCGPGYLPAMYVIQALPFLALCLAGVLRERSPTPSCPRAGLTRAASGPWVRIGAGVDGP